MNRNDILSQAQTIINGARQESYGDALKNFQLIATLWGSYLNATITPKEVADMMILLKIARNQNQTKEDNYIDICGYAALGAEVSDNLFKDKVTVLKEAKRFNKNLDGSDELHEFFDPIMNKLKNTEMSWFHNEFDNKTYLVTSKNVFQVLEDGVSLLTVLEKNDIPKSESQNKSHIRIISFGLKSDRNITFLKAIKEKLNNYFFYDYLSNYNLDALIFRSDYEISKDNRNYDKFYLIHNKEIYYFNRYGFPENAHYDRRYDTLTCNDITLVADEICNYLNSLDDENYKYFLRDSKKVEEKDETN